MESESVLLKEESGFSRRREEGEVAKGRECRLCLENVGC